MSVVSSPLLQHRVLVLNASFEAINICTAKRAMKLLLSEKACMVEHNGKQIRAERISFDLPEVIRLKNYIQLPYRPIPYSRKNILLRDDYTCQYCAESFDSDELTLDHIMPVSRGGKDLWTNVVAACKDCNHTKGNRLPEEAGMKLLRPAKKPGMPSFLHLVRLMGKQRNVWRKYLYYDETPSIKEVAVLKN